MNNIDRLTEQHNRLHASVEKLEKEHEQFPDDTEIKNRLMDLKKKKLQVKDNINQLMREEYKSREQFNFEEYDR